jgi:hypothetical protein
MIGFTVNRVDVDGFNKAIGNILATSKRDVRTVVNQQAKLLAQQCMHFTPPFADGKIPSGESGGTTKADERAGLEAVKNHIFRTMTPPSEMFPDPFTNKYLEKIVKRKDTAKIQKFFDNQKGELKGYKIKPFSSDLHTGKRIYGNRYRPKQQKIFVNDERPVQRYVKDVQSRVGYMKAGWGKGAVTFGGRVPAWVAKHIPYADGTAGVLNDNDDNYTVEMGNSTKGITRFTSNFQVAVRMRTNALTRMYNDYLAKNLQKNFQRA